jgi:hypothetical protein
MNNHGAEGSRAGGGGGQDGNTGRPRNLCIGKANVLYENRLLVPPDWRLPSGWKISSGSYAMPPILEGADLEEYIECHRAELTRRRRWTPIGPPTANYGCHFSWPS